MTRPTLSRRLTLTVAATAVATATLVGGAGTASAFPIHDGPPVQAVAVSRQAALPAKGTVEYSQWYAASYMKKHYGWGSDQMQCLVPMWDKESGWQTNADDSDNGYTWGIPQARPGTKMAEAGSDWLTNPETQIRWGLSYIKSTYGTPCSAWDFWQGHSWY